LSAKIYSYMTEQKREVSGYEEYHARQKWARNLAKEMGVSIDEGAEHFIIPVRDEFGNEISQIMLAARERIPLIDENGCAIQNSPDEKTAIEASKLHPNLSLCDALRKMGRL